MTADNTSTPSGGRARRRSRPSGDDRRRDILATAERLLSERRLDEISINDLAEGAGISRPSFYFHFATKDDVLLSLVDRLVVEGDERFAHLTTTQESDPVETFRQSIQVFVDVFTAHRAVLAAVRAHAQNELESLWSDSLARWITSVAGKIEAERARGRVHATTPSHDLATALILMNERVILAAVVGDRPALPVPDVTEVLLRIWTAAIYAPAELLDHPAPPSVQPGTSPSSMISQPAE